MTIQELKDFELELPKIKEAWNEINDRLNECQKALAELKESKKEGKWKPKEGEMYWFRCTDCDYLGCINKGTYDEWRIKHLPIFQTKEECVKYWKFRDAVKEKSYEFSREEWKNLNINKYSIYYNFSEKEWHIGYDWVDKSLYEIYFKTKEDAQYIIDNFKEELLKYWI